MKKPKVSLSGDAIKQMFSKHIEKIGLAIAFIALGILVFAAIRRETLPDAKAPEKLVAVVSSANESIQRIKRGELPVPKYDLPNPGVSQRNDQKIKDEVEAIPAWTAANPPVKDLSPKRTSVAIFPVLDLRTFADRGAIAMKKANEPPAAANPAPAKGPDGAAKKAGDKGAADNPLLSGGGGGAAKRPPAVAAPVGNPTITAQGRRFVMIMGLIPTLKQQAEFDAKFKEAMQPNPADDLFPGNIAGEPGKEKTSALDRFRPQYWWYSLQRREVAPDGSFGKEEVIDYKPVIQDRAKGWANSAAEICDPDYLDPRLTFGLPPLLLRNWDERVGHLPEIPLKSERPAGAPVAPAADDAGDPNNFDPLATNGPVKKKEAAAAEKIVTQKLFRIWDYGVQPDKSYQYRVQLILKNPNFQLHSRILETPDLAKEEYLRSDWSVWSPTASIPRDHQLLAAGVEYKADEKEPVAKVVCWSWSHENAVEVHHQFDLYRGGFAGDPEKFKFTVEAVNPAGGAAISLKDFLFRPNMMLLDFSGGVQSLKPPNPIPSADMVFLDAATNQLVVRRQAIDAAKLAVLGMQSGDGTMPGGMAFPGMDALPGLGQGSDKGKSGPANLLLPSPTGTVDKATAKGAKKN